MGKKDISIVSTPSFCYELQNFLNEKQIKTRIRLKNNIAEICFSREGSKKFVNWIYKDSNIHLNRKYQLYLNYYVS